MGWGESFNPFLVRTVEVKIIAIPEMSDQKLGSYFNSTIVQPAPPLSIGAVSTLFTSLRVLRYDWI